MLGLLNGNSAEYVLIINTFNHWALISLSRQSATLRQLSVYIVVRSKFPASSIKCLQRWLIANEAKHREELVET